MKAKKKMQSACVGSNTLLFRSGSFSSRSQQCVRVSNRNNEEGTEEEKGSIRESESRWDTMKMKLLLQYLLFRCWKSHFVEVFFILKFRLVQVSFCWSFVRWNSLSWNIRFVEVPFRWSFVSFRRSSLLLKFPFVEGPFRWSFVEVPFRWDFVEIVFR